MKRIKRDKALRAYTQGYKSGLHGHEMESCPVFDPEARGAWLRGWREGRVNLIYGYTRMAPMENYQQI